MSGKLKDRIMLFMRGWGYGILIVIVVTTSFRSAIADWNVVPTGSMEPTILIGDRIFVNKLAYDLKIPFTLVRLARWDDPRRGDIVVFFSPSDEKRLVKRVIGVPGDTIAMQGNKVFINGKMVEYEPPDPQIVAGFDKESNNENHGFFNEDLSGRKHAIMTSPRSLAIRSFHPVEIPEGNYFMMGDNRDQSGDSRYFGFVERKRIVGKATAIVMSLRINTNYLPRWDRFFQKLI